MTRTVKLFLLIFLINSDITWAQLKPEYNLRFDHLAARWDEAMPLGNGMLGVLVWEKDSRLRLSLDRADLWDERKALDLSKFNFNWVRKQVLANDYDTVHRLGDLPYDKMPYPTKLPAAALEFDISSFGRVVSNVLDIKTALNTVEFENGTIFKTYIHAVQPEGYFSFESLPPGASDVALTSALPHLIIHNYNDNGNGRHEQDNSHSGEGLQKLGYAKSTMTTTANTIRYHQPTYDGHYFEVLVKWKETGHNQLAGRWTISCDRPAELPAFSASLKEKNWRLHLAWRNRFWSKSAVTLPDTLLEKQYYLEMYKLGCVSRPGAPAITLQAVWTADNGSLPPWKGDFHNDLNTQLSYWPAYTGNHLTEAASYTDWLWKIRDKNKQYTRQYFGVDGLNVPGVVTLSGDPMGGWIQYSLGPTVSAWCAQYFYWQWKYTMDEEFLKTRTYPYMYDVATYLENITFLKNGVRRLPLSSSPEYNDNSINAWFLNWTNFDLALAKFLFEAASEVAKAIGKNTEADHWQKILHQLPGYAIDETGLMVAEGQDLAHSHRHLSPYMAIYPLALLDINKQEDSVIIEHSLKHLEEKGTRAWCGYSFSWMASLYARAYKGDKAVKQLQIFASNFCSPNSFHLNGDQRDGQYSDFTYRPFTLEGNFAFAQGVQELLLQSRNGYIQVFPAVPADWRNISFDHLRAEGAFLISARKKNGVFTQTVITSEKGGVCKIKLPFTHIEFSGKQKRYRTNDGILEFRMEKNETVTIVNASDS